MESSGLLVVALVCFWYFKLQPLHWQGRVRLSLSPVTVTVGGPGPADRPRAGAGLSELEASESLASGCASAAGGPGMASAFLSSKCLLTHYNLKV